MLLRLIDGAPKNSERWLNNVDRTHLALASGKTSTSKTMYKKSWEVQFLQQEKLKTS